MDGGHSQVGIRAELVGASAVEAAVVAVVVAAAAVVAAATAVVVAVADDCCPGQALGNSRLSRRKAGIQRARDSQEGWSGIRARRTRIRRGRLRYR